MRVDLLDAELHVESTTIMFADVVESVRLIEQDEIGNVTRIRSLLSRLATDLLPMHNGELLERRGDGLLVIFDRSRDAITCATRMHALAAASCIGESDDNSIALRIGIHSAEVIADEEAIYGRGINVAARIASLAGPRETLVSADAAEGIIDGYDCRVEDLGNRYVKNSHAPIRVYRVGGVGPGPSIPLGASDVEAALPSIAVLPLRVDADDDNANSAADLAGETVTFSLCRAKSLQVIAWSSCRALARTSLSAKESAALLDVDWVVTGSFRQLGDKFLITTELMNRSSDAVVHAGRYAGSVADLLQAESMTAAQIASDVVGEITQREANRATKYALPTLHAHSLLLGAVGLMHRSASEQFTRSRLALEHLLERHPRMHAARPWLAQWYVLQTTRGFAQTTETQAGLAIDQTSRCLDVRADDTFALAVRGFIFFHMKQDLARAKDSLDRAVALDANDPLACVFSAVVMNVEGRVQESWRLAQRALTLSPFDPNKGYMQLIAATSARGAGEFAHAITLAKEALRHNSAHPSAWRTLVMALAQIGDIEAAREAACQLLIVQPGLTLSSYRTSYPMLGERLNVAVDALRVAGVPE